MIRRIRAFMSRRRNIKALERLSQRELEDIGITRGQIYDLARNR